MQALDTSSVASALIAHFENRRQFHSGHYAHGLVQSYLSDDPIQPALAFVMALPDAVSNSALGRIEESLYIRENIEHPHLGPVLERGRLGDRMVYWLVGVGWSRTLSDVFSEPHPNQNRLLNLMLQVGEGLEAMHDEGLCFGGLNEQGIFVGLNRDGVENAFLAGCSVDAWVPELQKIDIQHLDMRQANVLAPECVGGGLRSIASDLYAYGALLFRALTGRYPFEAPTVEGLFEAHLQQVVCADEADMPEPLWSMVLQCLRKDPHVRPDSISEVLSCLRSYISGGHEVEMSSTDTVSIDESSVPGNMILDCENSEDILCLISDYLEGGSDEDSSLSLVVHKEVAVPELPAEDEVEITDTLLEGSALPFDVHAQEPEAEAVAEPLVETAPTDGGLTFSLFGDWDEEHTDDVSDVELDPQPISVVVGVVPFQGEYLPTSKPVIEAQPSEDDISIDAFNPDADFRDIAEAAKVEIADAIAIVSEDSVEAEISPDNALVVPVLEEALEPSLCSEDKIIHEAAMVADLSISEDEVVVAVVPVLEEASDEDTIFPAAESVEPVEAKAASVVLPDELEVTERVVPAFEGEQRTEQDHEETASLAEFPLAEVSVTFEDEDTVLMGGRSVARAEPSKMHLWNVSVVELVPNLVFGFVALNVIAFVTNLIF